MTFPFNTNIPSTGGNPSQQYTIMRENNESASGIMSVDHITYGNNGAGTHKQVTLESFSLPVSPASQESSVIYPKAGMANINNAQLNFQNFTSTVLLSALKIFAQLNIQQNTGTVNLLSPNYSNIILTGSTQSFNSGSRILTLTVNLTDNVLVGNDGAVFIIPSSNSNIENITYTLSASQLIIQIRFTSSTPLFPTFVNFAILQA